MKDKPILSLITSILGLLVRDPNMVDVRKRKKELRLAKKELRVAERMYRQLEREMKQSGLNEDEKIKLQELKERINERKISLI